MEVVTQRSEITSSVVVEDQGMPTNHNTDYIRNVVEEYLRSSLRYYLTDHQDQPAWLKDVIKPSKPDKSILRAKEYSESKVADMPMETVEYLNPKPGFSVVATEPVGGPGGPYVKDMTDPFNSINIHTIQIPASWRPSLLGTGFSSVPASFDVPLPGTLIGISEGPTKSTLVNLNNEKILTTAKLWQWLAWGSPLWLYAISEVGEILANNWNWEFSFIAYMLNKAIDSKGNVMYINNPIPVHISKEWIPTLHIRVSMDDILLEPPPDPEDPGDDVPVIGDEEGVDPIDIISDESEHTLEGIWSPVSTDAYQFTSSSARESYYPTYFPWNPSIEYVTLKMYLAEQESLGVIRNLTIVKHNLVYKSSGVFTNLEFRRWKFQYEVLSSP
jgi:hypothetical protein